ncbi:MAG: mtgA2 [Gemmatimonadetes bacterium]|nr:mtgA2 [Gemmatimonadota bacterium]
MSVSLATKRETQFAPASASSVLQFLQAVGQVRRLVDENPSVTSFMKCRRPDSPDSGDALSHWVPLHSVSPFLLCAAVGAEDPLFFQHGGIWWGQIRIAILRALIYRRPVRGVSTITQQLARNLFLAPNRSLSRKICEALLARRLETMLTKARILELYFNVVEWGDQLWGIEAASRTYCGCAPSELDSFQSIVLVSLLPAPRAPLIGRNAQRALATQRRLAPFLYSVGLLSLVEERDMQLRICDLAKELERGLTLTSVLSHERHATAAARHAGTPTVEALLANQCGWLHRLRFEGYLARARTGLDPGVRPLWWAHMDAASAKGEGL